MSHEMINDFGLTSKELEAKYESVGAHPALSDWHWRQAVEQRNTRSGYWDWVSHAVAEYEDELARCNPYTQWERDFEL